MPTTAAGPDIEVRLATSADQIAARVIGKTTQVPSIEMNLDLPTQGACDTSDCFFNNTISWRNADHAQSRRGCIRAWCSSGCSAMAEPRPSASRG